MDHVKGRIRDEALRRLGALDGTASVGLDKLARLAKFVAGSQYAAIHLLGDAYQDRVAEAGGLPLGRDPAADSMCLPVVESERPVYVPDATQAKLFAQNANTTGPTPVRLFSATPFRDDQGVTIGTLCVFDHDSVELSREQLDLLGDLAEHVREHLELHGRVRQLGHAATHDPLTGLANRALLSQMLARAMTRRRRRPGEPALALIDLDGFKAVNDSLGHQAGDDILVQLGRRLLALAREEDTVARLGGDEFVVLYEQLPDEGADVVVAGLQRRLIDALADPYLVEGDSITVNASIGFVRSRADELGYELLGRADLAMYEKKRSSSA
jgi:diguanylate cyclase (GGDEF)-like protein